MVSNMRGSKKVDALFTIWDNDGNLAEEISEKEYRTMFNNDFQRLSEYAN